MANLVITTGLLDNKYTINAKIDSLTTGAGSETELIADYGDPVVSVGGSIDVTTTTLALNVADSSGFTLSETITGGTSSSTATVWKLAAGIIYVTSPSGAFTAGETLTGGTSGQTEVLVSNGATTTQFFINYGSNPNSTADFTASLATRRIVSELLNVTWTFDGDIISTAENNALDLIIQIKSKVAAEWTILKSNVNTYEGVDTTPLP